MHKQQSQSRQSHSRQSHSTVTGLARARSNTPYDASRVLALQQAVGNRAVLRLMATQATTVQRFGLDDIKDAWHHVKGDDKEEDAKDPTQQSEDVARHAKQVAKVGEVAFEKLAKEAKVRGDSEGFSKATEAAEQFKHGGELLETGEKVFTKAGKAAKVIRELDEMAEACRRLADADLSDPEQQRMGASAFDDLFGGAGRWLPSYSRMDRERVLHVPAGVQAVRLLRALGRQVHPQLHEQSRSRVEERLSLRYASSPPAVGASMSSSDSQGGDIDVDANTVRIKRQTVEFAPANASRTTTKPEAGTRTVHLPPSVSGALAAHIDRFSAEGNEALVFIGPLSNGLRRGNALQAGKKARHGVGLDQLHLHDLGHAAGTLAAQTGATTRELMYRLGHTSPAAAHRLPARR